MKLFLQNFLCYDEKTYEIPDNGLILISADSGKGKTTLLLSIIYALYGSVKKVAGLDRKTQKTYVKLEFTHQHMIVERSNRPGRLLCTYKDKVFEGSEAQSYINEFIGMEEHEFLLSRCLVQGINNILSTTPLQMLTIIRKLCCEDEAKKNNMKKKLKETLAELEKGLLDKTKEKSVLSSVLKAPKKVEKTPPLKKIKEKIAGVEKIKKDIEKNIALLREKEKKMKEFSVQHNTFEKLLERYRTQKADNTSLLEKYESFKKISENARDAKLILKNALVRYEHYKKYKNLLEYQKEIQKSRFEFEKNKKELELVEKKIENLKAYEIERGNIIKRNEQILAKREKLVREINSLGFNFSEIENENTTSLYFFVVCPCCENALKIDEEYKAVKAEGEEHKDIGEIDPTKYHNLSKAKKLFSLYKENYTDPEKVPESKKKILDSMLAKKRNLSSLKIQTLSQTDEKELASLKIEFKRESSDAENFDSPPMGVLEKTLEEKIKKYKIELKMLEAQLVEITRIQENVKNILDNIKDIEEKIMALQEKEDSFLSDDIVPRARGTISELESDLKKKNECIVKLTLLKENAIKYEKYVEEYNEYSKSVQKINKLSSDVFEIKKDHEKLTFAKNCTDQAELVSTEKNVSFLNERIRAYLCDFFNEGSALDVRLVLGKETGKGRNKKIKNVLNIEICCGQSTYDSIKRISKGERKRIKMAFMLAFSDVIQKAKQTKIPPIYLLDECLSNLHCDMQTDIISKLSERKGVFLIVSHSAIKGIFDNCITW